MRGFSPKLPLSRDKIDGYRLTKTPREVIKQNFKNLVLTSPGERIMLPEFGVGLRRYLFEPQNTVVMRDIRGRIQDQVSQYMPYIKVNEVRFYAGASTETGPNRQIISLDEFNFDFSQKENMLQIFISYTVTSFNLEDELSLRFEEGK